MDNQNPNTPSETPPETPSVVVQPSPDDAGTGENKVVIPSSQESSTVTESKKAVLDPAMAGRVSALEKERNQYSKEAADLRKLKEDLEKKAKFLETINEDFADDPEAYEKWRKVRIKRTGEDPGTYETLYGKPKTSEVSDNRGTDPNYVNQVVAQSIEYNKGWEEFKSKFPELDPKNFKTEEEIEKAKKVYREIEPVAIALRTARPYMSTGDALISAYNTLHQDEALKDAQRTGEAIGRQNAYAQGIGSMGYIQGGQASKSTQRTVTLTRDQQKEYDKLKAQNPKLADKYAEAIADMQS